MNIPDTTIDSLDDALSHILKEALTDLGSNVHENVQNYVRAIARDGALALQAADPAAIHRELIAQLRATAELQRIQLSQQAWTTWNKIVTTALDTMLRTALALV